MNLEVGMHCYNKTNRKLGIGKIISFQRNNNVNIKYKNDIELVSVGNIEASHNIIDLIEEGDYVNGLPVTRICIDDETNEKYLNMFGSISEYGSEDIKSIELLQLLHYKLDFNNSIHNEIEDIQKILKEVE